MFTHELTARLSPRRLQGSLYRSILEQVSTRLRDEFTTAVRESTPDPATTAHLATARADPAGYRLLFVHARSEPEFATYANEIMAIITAVADTAFGDAVPDPLRRWATDLSVHTLVQAVLGWLDHGDPDHDEMFVDRTSASLTALVTALTD